jgi:asparagine synthase (glutamine-hydrolysing)
VALMTPEVARSLLRTPVDGLPFGTTRQHFLDGDFTKELDHVMAGDIRTYLLDDILVKVDRMTMACSLEGRAPLLDHELAEFAARLPLPMKQGPTAGKRLLRKVADRLLPGSTRHKRKQGFAIPLARWFREGLRELLFDTLLSRGFQERGVFDAATAVAFAEAHRSKAVDHGELLWLLLTFELWAARFQEGEPS